MSLDVKTVILLTVFVEGFFAVTTLLLTLSLKRIRGPFWWFVSTSSILVGLLLLIFQTASPGVLWLYAGNLLVLWAMTSMTIGMDRFVGGRGRRLLFCLMAAVFAGLYLLFRENFELRLVAFLAAAVVFNGISSGILLRSPTVSSVQKPIGVLYALIGAAYFVRLLVTVLIPPESGFTSLAANQGGTHLLNFLIILFVGSSYLILITFRFQEELQKSNQELAHRDKAKGRFFAILSHDLRGPISGMYRLLESTGASREPLSGEMVQILRETAGQTYKLLEDLLLWAKSQNGDMPRQIGKFPVDLAALSAWRVFQALAMDKRIQYQSFVEKNLLAVGEESMTVTILRNFFSNAIKFSRPGGLIQFRASRIEGMVRIQVSDNGVGMDQEKMDNLFQIEKIHSDRGTADEPGSGLGLVLCKELADRQNGRLEVESRPGEGTTMTLLLPAAD